MACCKPAGWLSCDGTGRVCSQFCKTRCTATGIGWPGTVVLVIRLLAAVLVWLLSGRGAVFTEPGLASCCSKFSSSVRALAALIDGLLLLADVPAAVLAAVLAEGRAYRSAAAAAGRAGCG